MKSSEQEKSFWVSYSDLLTSLFFVMLVLFISTFVFFKNKVGDIIMKAEAYEKIVALDNAVKNLNQDYFHYDEKNKRFRLNVDLRFNPNSANILDIPLETRKKIRDAGKDILDLLDELQSEFPGVEFLLVIEGNTQISGTNFQTIPNEGYRLSYNRALSLNNYWKQNGIDLRGTDNCEVLLVGSGYFGKAREKIEVENRKFTIQISPKVGKFLDAP
jgi:outer membrane protein OmpA-like peptidoglycan-associated protein